MSITLISKENSNSNIIKTFSHLMRKPSTLPNYLTKRRSTSTQSIASANTCMIRLECASSCLLTTMRSQDSTWEIWTLFSNNNTKTTMLCMSTMHPPIIPEKWSKITWNKTIFRLKCTQSSTMRKIWSIVKIFTWLRISIASKEKSWFSLMATIHLLGGKYFHY